MEEQQVSKEYLEGFNTGYILAEHKPKLFLHLDGLQTKGEYLQGLKDGGGEYLLEKYRDKNNTQEHDNTRNLGK